MRCIIAHNSDKIIEQFKRTINHIVTMHPEIASFLAELEERPACRMLWRGAPEISFYRAEIRRRYKRARRNPNITGRYLTHRYPRFALSAPRGESR